MSRTALIYSIALSLLIVNLSVSQTPTLDPLQTVNPATGEMGFALPLGAVKGLNGKDFPVTVNYKAGILTAQEASAVGLGFSYGPGGITRKVNFVPDDNAGGPTSFQKTQMIDLHKPWYYWVVIIGSAVVSYISSCFFDVVNATISDIVMLFVSQGFNIAMSMNSSYVKSSSLWRLHKRDLLRSDNLPLFVARFCKKNTRARICKLDRYKRPYPASTTR